MHHHGEYGALKLCYNTFFDLIKTSVTIEAMKLMVKAIVTAIVKAAVTAMFIELLEEELKHYIYVRCNICSM